MDNFQESWQDLKIKQLSQPITSKDNYWGALLFGVLTMAGITIVVWLVYWLVEKMRFWMAI